ncbi:hypothetical protein C5167_041365 [Papaver somniferum]|nr:hypothetical protein C5167_041365 [Papaver somniferum]
MNKSKIVKRNNAFLVKEFGNRNQMVQFYNVSTFIQWGFYVYDNKRKARHDPEIAKYIEKARRMSDAKVDPKLMKLSDKDIIEMIFFPVVNESCRLLHEGIVVKASDLDIAAVSGMGFPPYKGGIMFWADSLASKYICSRLEEWTKMYGDFFKPYAYLDKRASKGAKLCINDGSSYVSAIRRLSDYLLGYKDADPVKENLSLFHFRSAIPSLNSEILEFRRLRKWMEKLEESDRKLLQLLLTVRPSNFATVSNCCGILTLQQFLAVATENSQLLENRCENLQQRLS